MASGAPRAQITTGIFSTDKVSLNQNVDSYVKQQLSKASKHQSIIQWQNVGCCKFLH